MFLNFPIQGAMLEDVPSLFQKIRDVPRGNIAALFFWLGIKIGPAVPFGSKKTSRLQVKVA